MNNPIFKSSYWKDEVLVYSTHISYKQLLGATKVIPLNKIADISKPLMALTGVNITLTSGETMKLSMKQDRIKEFMEVVSKLMSNK